jgi:hypothetical protein
MAQEATEQDQVPFERKSVVREVQKTSATQIKALMPRRAKSHQIGAYKFRTDGPEVVFHLYEIPLTAKEKAEDDNPDAGESHNCRLDILELRKTKTRKKWVRINSISLQNLPFHEVSFDLKWADPKRKQIPIISIYLVTVGFTGGFGEYLLVNFPKGLSKPATYNGFSWGGNSYETTNVSFEEVDERGFMIIRSDFHEFSAERNTPTFFIWNGSKFVKRQ